MYVEMFSMNHLIGRDWTYSVMFVDVQTCNLKPCDTEGHG